MVESKREIGGKVEEETVMDMVFRDDECQVRTPVNFTTLTQCRPFSTAQ
jgi:hypothetical protein